MIRNAEAEGANSRSAPVAARKAASAARIGVAEAMETPGKDVEQAGGGAVGRPREAGAMKVKGSAAESVAAPPGLTPAKRTDRALALCKPQSILRIARVRGACGSTLARAAPITHA